MNIDTADLPDDADFDADDVSIPENSCCPRCGTQATEESIAEIKLSALGYKHGDVFFECDDEDCGNDWIHGVPVGSSTDFQDDLWCDSCDNSWYRIHRVVPHISLNWDEEDWEVAQIQLHMKCPNCYHFTLTNREGDGERTALIGWPQITGEIDETVDEYGYTNEN